MKLHLEPRTVQRDAALRAAAGEREPVRSAEEDLRAAVRRTALRSMRFGVGGTVVVALMLGLALAALGERRGLRLVGAPLLVIAFAVAICLLAMERAQATFNQRAFDNPTFYARGAELVQLLEAAENARQAGEGYASKVQAAVGGFASLLSAPTAGSVDASRPALLVSDLHNNRLALRSLRDYAKGKPVFFLGDFGNTGSAAEARVLAPDIADLGRQVIAVSGNHDSTLLMRALARRGVTVLTRRGVLRADGGYGAATLDVAGLVVAGFDDPREWRGQDPTDPRRIFSFPELPNPEQATARANQQALGWFDRLPQPPDVVLLHQNGLAQTLARTLYQRGYARPLTVLTGHDHAQQVTSYGTITVVDAGTVGASGLYGVGKDSVGLGELHFAPNGELQAADLIAVEPVAGDAEARRVVIDTCEEASGVCRRLAKPQRPPGQP